MYKNELIVEVPGGKKWRVRLQDVLFRQVLRACDTYGFPVDEPAKRVRPSRAKLKPTLALVEEPVFENLVEPVTVRPAKAVPEAAGKDAWGIGRGGNNVIRASFGRVWGRSDKTADLARALRQLGVEPRDPKYRADMGGTGVYWQDASNEQLYVAWMEVFNGASH